MTNKQEPKWLSGREADEARLHTAQNWTVSPKIAEQMRANQNAWFGAPPASQSTADMDTRAMETAAQWTVDSTRCAVSGADLTKAVQEIEEHYAAEALHTLTPADCGPGVGGAAQGPPEIVVTDEMVAAGDAVWSSSHLPASLAETYRAMAAVAPVDMSDASARDHAEAWANECMDRIAALETENAKLRADPVELYRADERRIDALEAENVHLKELLGAECPALAKELENEIRHLQFENRSLAYQCRVATGVLLQIQPRGCLVPQYLVDTSDIPVLTPQYEAEVASFVNWMNGLSVKDARIAALEAENVTLRTRAGERDASALQALRRRVTSWPLVVLATACLTLTACSTPVTTMRNPQTGAVATCGGGVGGSILGGVAGYNIEQSLDQKCQAQLLAGGFERVR